MYRTDVQQDFLRRARECRRAAAELHALLSGLYGVPSGSSAIGAVHRGWVPEKRQLAHYSNPALLAETARGEDIAMATYRKALDEPLPPPLRGIVQRQFEGIVRHQAQVREYRHQAMAPSA